jgi:signal transduction histidine kinase
VRPRLTASFVVLSVLLLLGALGVRSYTSHGLLRTHEGRTLRAQAATFATAIEQRVELGRPVDRAFLSALVDSPQRLTYEPAGATPVVVEGQDYDDGGDDPLSTTVAVGDATLTVAESGDVVDELADNDLGSLGFLVLLEALLAALVGYVMARQLSGPFRQLAIAAGQLGRGRFDLDLPRTQVPEARAVSQALLTSAGQLQERLATEQTFAEHASHVLRTPLTGLRLELEDLAGRDDVPADVRESATRSVGRIEAMDQVAGDLVALARRGALVAGAEIPLRDLATQSAQVWADALDEQGRAVSAAVEGSIDTTYTPGPVEHILDLLLADVLRRGRGGTRLVFEADEEGHLSIDVSCEAARPATGPNDGINLTQARAVVTALGGRITGETPERLSVLLPRR